MKRAFRLLKRDDFQTVLNQKKVIYGKKVIVFFHHNPTVNHPRFGVIAVKKKFKRAVDRNYHRRLLYQAIWTINPLNFPVNDYVFFLRQQLDDILFTELQKDLLTLVSKINSYRSKS